MRDCVLSSVDCNRNRGTAFSFILAVYLYLFVRTRAQMCSCVRMYACVCLSDCFFRDHSSLLLCYIIFLDASSHVCFCVYDMVQVNKTHGLHDLSYEIAKTAATNELSYAMYI